MLGASSGPSGAIWPYRFVTASIESDLASHQSFRIETNTQVNSVAVSESDPTHPYQLHTNRGVISATTVVHATNAHAAHLLPNLQGKVLPLRGQMSVQSRPKEFPIEGERSYILHYERGYDYMTQAPSEPGEIYLGGGFLRDYSFEDEDDIGHVHDDQISTKALEVLRRIIPLCFTEGAGAEVTHAWTGVMGFTSDDLPIVGKVPTSISGRTTANLDSGEWVSAGFNGHGMAYCWLSGKALAQMMVEGEKSVGDWFPKEHFACSEERMAGFSAKRTLEFFASI